MRSAATCHRRERHQDARIVSRTWPGSIGSAVRNRSLAWASRVSSVTPGRTIAPRDMPTRPAITASAGLAGPARHQRCASCLHSKRKSASTYLKMRPLPFGREVILPSAPASPASSWASRPPRRVGGSWPPGRRPGPLIICPRLVPASGVQDWPAQWECLAASSHRGRAEEQVHPDRGEHQSDIAGRLRQAARCMKGVDH